MVYRIMFVVQEKDDLGTIYKFDTTEIDGVTQYREFSTDE